MGVFNSVECGIQDNVNSVQQKFNAFIVEAHFGFKFDEKLREQVKVKKRPLKNKILELNVI